MGSSSASPTRRGPRLTPGSGGAGAAPGVEAAGLPRRRLHGVAEALVQVLASQQPPASCQQAWEDSGAVTSMVSALLLVELSKANAGMAGRAITAGALPQLTRVLRWGAQRLEQLGRRGLWEEGADKSCASACGGLLCILWCSRPSAVTPAVQAELPQLAQLVLQRSCTKGALAAASRLLALLREPGSKSKLASNQHCDNGAVWKVSGTLGNAWETSGTPGIRMERGYVHNWN